MTFASRLTLFVLICSALLMAANNPVPFVNQPLVPASVAPGGNNFQLTVNGTGFVSGSTVNWNGSPRATTFVNQGQLTATILATDIATASTASITVTSPAPGGGASSVAFLPVRNPSSFVSLNTTSLGTQLADYGVATGDLNKDGNQDLVAFVQDQNEIDSLSILLGNGNGTFSQGAEYVLGYGAGSESFVVADINGDGNLDLVFPSYNGTLIVLLGNGNGTFQQPVVYPVSAQLFGAVVGDFNHDGFLDVVAVQYEGVCVFLGNGDGTFQAGNCATFGPSEFYGITAGDFNSDGTLDLALTGPLAMAVLLGNGDGTFRPSQTYASGVSTNSPVTADLNGDGILDLVAVYGNGSSVLIFLGKGDGTFQAPASYPTAFDPAYATLSDMNGDGKLDLVVGDYAYNVASVSVLLGNGDGTFQTYVDYYGSGEGFPAIADFNGDGKPDVAVPNGTFDTISILTQDNGTVLNLSHDNVKFPTQAVGTVSQPKLITVTNNGTSAVKFSGISATANFSQLSNCKLIQPDTSCEIGVYFTPTTQGTLPGYLAIADNGGGSPQLVTLSGVATIVELAPTSLNFGNWHVGSFSKSQDVIVTNNGNGPLQISKIAIGGADPRDFYQVNACPAKLAAGSSCTITVLFHPTATGARSALLGVEDNGGGSPQTVTLSGTGT